MFLEAEAAIADWIRALLPSSVRILVWPDTPAEMSRVWQKDAIYVRWGGITLSPREGSRGHEIQWGTIFFEVRLLVKDLRSHTGAYALLEQIQSALSGQRPAPVGGYSFDVSGLSLTKISLVEREDASHVWDWGAMFECGICKEG